MGGTLPGLPGGTWRTLGVGLARVRCRATKPAALVVSAPYSAAALRFLSQAASEASRIVRMRVMPASTGWPAKDSCVVTWTPAGVLVKSHSWIPVMPPAVPPYSTRAWSAAA